VVPIITVIVTTSPHLMSSSSQIWTYNFTLLLLVWST